MVRPAKCLLLSTGNSKQKLQLSLCQFICRKCLLYFVTTEDIYQDLPEKSRRRRLPGFRRRIYTLVKITVALEFARPSISNTSNCEHFGLWQKGIKDKHWFNQQQKFSQWWGSSWWQSCRFSPPSRPTCSQEAFLFGQIILACGTQKFSNRNDLPSWCLPVMSGL